MIKKVISLTEGQKKFLENLPPHKKVLVKPWNHKGVNFSCSESVIKMVSLSYWGDLCALF